VIALAFVTQPERMIGTASGWSNDMSAAFLSLSRSGEVDSRAEAKRAASDQLFELLVYEQVVDLDVQLARLGLGGLADGRCGAGQAVVGLGARACGDVLGDLGGPLEHRAGLLAHAGQRVAHGALGAAQRQRVVDERADPRDVGVDAWRS
jgi:hypothetical protein